MQNAKWAWIHSVMGFVDFDKKRKCQQWFKVNGSKLVFSNRRLPNNKIKTGEDYQFNADNAKIPKIAKIKGHNGEVLHYLCIDSTKGKDYLHIGFIYEQGSEVRCDFMGQTIIIKNAKNLDFDFSQDSAIGNKMREKYAHLDSPNVAKNYKVTECRNFWFGAYYFGS